MESPLDPFSLARLVIGGAVLFHAARADLGTRRVADWCWWLFLGAGLVILEAELIYKGEGLLYLLSPFYIAVFFVTLWFEGELFGDEVRRRDSAVVAVALNAGAIAVLWAQLSQAGDMATASGFRHLQLLSVPVMMLLAYILYRTQLLSGGADAKAFLSLAVLVPFYLFPTWDLLHTPTVFLLICPFVLAVFFNAAFFGLFNPLGLIVYNLTRGDAGRLMAFAYRIDIKDARNKKFVWLSESIEGEKRVYHYFRFRYHTRKWKLKQLDLLEKSDEKRVWVQPQIPFMVQLFIGFLFTSLLGNAILWGVIRLFAGV